MNEPVRFCIRSVTPEEHRALVALDPPATPHDCLNACTDCFHRPVLAQGGQHLSDAQAVGLLDAGRELAAGPAEPS